MAEGKPPAVTLAPYQAFAGYAFTLRPADLLTQRRLPLRSRRNEVALDEMDYGDVVLRFQVSGRLEEITAQATALAVGTLVIPLKHLQAYIEAHDPQAFWRARFLISPRLGLAYDPTEPPWVTALARHCLPQWEAL